MLHTPCKLLYFFDFMVKVALALLFTAVENGLVLLGWNVRALGSLPAAQQLVGDRCCAVSF